MSAKLNKVLTNIGIASLISLASAGIAFAGQTAALTATVTAQNISVSVTSGAVAFGTVALSASSDTTSNGINDSQTATNDGNITETFNIKDSGSTASWTLGASAGADTYVDYFCTTTCDTTPTWTALTTSYATLASNISTSGTSVFDLKFSAPTTTSDYTQQSLSITVQATQ